MASAESEIRRFKETMEFKRAELLVNSFTGGKCKCLSKDKRKEISMDEKNHSQEIQKEAKVLKMIVTEAEKQIGNHLKEWDEKIYETYTKSGKELSVSFQVKLKGNSQSVKVETQMSFTTGKVTEKLEGEVNLAPELPFEEKKDAKDAK